MKVVKWSTEVTCTGCGNGNNGCGAKLIIEESDLYETPLSCLPNEVIKEVVFAAFTCPECGVETLPLEGIPDYILKRVRADYIKFGGRKKPKTPAPVSQLSLRSIKENEMKLAERATEVDLGEAQEALKYLSDWSNNIQDPAEKQKYEFAIIKVYESLTYLGS